MRYSLERGAIPAEPLTLAEAKLHLREDNDDQDALITALIQAAREWVENYCRRSLVRRTLTLRMDSFPCGEIHLPRGPVSAVSSISANGSAVAAAVYETDLYSTPARIRTAFGQVWPVVDPETNAVVIIYTAGYEPGAGSPTDYAENVPAAIKAAMKLIIGHLYEHREQVDMTQMFEVPFAVRMLLAPYEIRDFDLE